MACRRPLLSDEDEEVMNLEQTEEMLRCSYFFCPS